MGLAPRGSDAVDLRRGPRTCVSSPSDAHALPQGTTRAELLSPSRRWTLNSSNLNRAVSGVPSRNGLQGLQPSGALSLPHTAQKKHHWVLAEGTHRPGEKVPAHALGPALADRTGAGVAGCGPAEK